MEWETIQANARDVVKLRRDNALLQIQLRDSTVRVQAVESLLADKVTEIAQLKHEGAANVRLLASYKGLISSLDALARTQAAAS
jgi:hypothetical protein